MVKDNALREQLNERWNSTSVPKRWVSIDPASGASSYPAISVWDEAVLVNRILLKPYGKSHWVRLHNLFELLCDGLASIPYDIVVIEKIAAMFGGKSSGGGSFQYTNDRILHLHHACGVIGAAFDAVVIEVAPCQWQSTLRRKGQWDNYVKTDLNDSTAIGMCLIAEYGGTPVLDAETTKSMWRV